MKLLYSQLNTLNARKSIKNRVYSLDWEISDNDLIELARSLYCAKIAYNKGRNAQFIEIERDLESFFNKKVKRPHNKVTRISERVDIAPFLDTLKDCYVKDLESRL